MGTVYGIDGCRNGWVWAAKDLETGDVRWAIYPSLDRILANHPSVVAIDVPIGLTDSGARTCDEEARRLLGRPRGSSVFPAPLRCVLDAASYADACGACRSIHAKAISRQAWAIVRKIREVDRLLCSRPGLQSLVREVHPEVCFQFMASCRMVHGKKSREGRDERTRLLRRELGGVIDRAMATRSALACAPDDLLDAFACLWTAIRIANDTAETLPGVPPPDRFGLKMEIVA